MIAMYRAALYMDPEGFMAVVDMALQVWRPVEMVRWLETPQRRWDGKSPIDLIATAIAEAETRGEVREREAWIKWIATPATFKLISAETEAKTAAEIHNHLVLAAIRQRGDAS